MDKKYSVDDILSEIHRTKQRREEPSSDRYSVEERYRQYLQQERSEPPASQPKEERREEKPIRFSNAVHREEPLREQESAPRPRKEAPIAAEEKSFFQTSVSVEREEQPILQKAQEEDPFVRTSFDRESFQSFFGQGGAVDEKEERRKEKMRLKEEK